MPLPHPAPAPPTRLPLCMHLGSAPRTSQVRIRGTNAAAGQHAPARRPPPRQSARPPGGAAPLHELVHRSSPNRAMRQIEAGNGCFHADIMEELVDLVVTVDRPSVIALDTRRMPT